MVKNNLFNCFSTAVLSKNQSDRWFKLDNFGIFGGEITNPLDRQLIYSRHDETCEWRKSHKFPIVVVQASECDAIDKYSERLQMSALILIHYYFFLSLKLQRGKYVLLPPTIDSRRFHVTHLALNLQRCQVNLFSPGKKKRLNHQG